MTAETFNTDHARTAQEDESMVKFGWMHATTEWVLGNL